MHFPRLSLWQVMIGVDLLILDQVTKFFWYDRGYCSDCLLIYPILNTGISYSLPVPVLLVIAITIGVIGLIVWLWKKRQLTSWVMVLFLAGAIGNLIDRVVYAGVRDFAMIPSEWLFGFQYPIFNVADVVLNVAVIVFVYQEFVVSKKNQSRHK